MSYVKGYPFLLAVIGCLGSISANAAPVYLNIDNITVEVGPGTTATSSNNTFNNGQTINKVIDAPSATAEEFHNQTTHIWFSGGTLELLFDFKTQYDLTTLHFWNYTSEDYDVDSIAFTFFDATRTFVGELLVLPELGTSPGITAQDYVLAAPLNVQFVTAVLAGSNNQIDFQNIGFTANLSTDRCDENPNDPICTPSTAIPAPASLTLISLGILGLALNRRRKFF